MEGRSLEEGDRHLSYQPAPTQLCPCPSGDRGETETVKALIQIHHESRHVEFSRKHDPKSTHGVSEPYVDV